MTPVRLLSSRCTVRRLCNLAEPGALWHVAGLRGSTSMFYDMPWQPSQAVVLGLRRSNLSTTPGPRGNRQWPRLHGNRHSIRPSLWGAVSCSLRSMGWVGQPGWLARGVLGDEFILKKIILEGEVGFDALAPAGLVIKVHVSSLLKLVCRHLRLLMALEPGHILLVVAPALLFQFLCSKILLVGSLLIVENKEKCVSAKLFEDLRVVEGRRGRRRKGWRCGIGISGHILPWTLRIGLAWSAAHAECKGRKLMSTRT
mmetsp:Transcript_30789/g.101024  ORF Transcript_30789/g.101024 Transcript_30789/m.101024 type:complete len:256 (-) Transcript_30789:1388-2155(-)